MKFGKKILESANPEWQSQFLAYRPLKKCLKRIKKRKIKSEKDVSDYEYDLDEDEGFFLAALKANRHLSPGVRKFFEYLEDELKKINKFYLFQESKFKSRHEQLQKNLETMKANGKVSKAQFDILEAAFKEQYLGLMLLNNYRTLNYTGFCKILKKFDKATGNDIHAKFGEALQVQPFYSSPLLKELMTLTEQLAALELYGGNRKVAMSILRVPVHDDPSESQGTTQFTAGIFVGGSLVMIVALIYYYIFHFSTEPVLVEKYLREVFMYKFILFPIIMCVLIALNIRIWAAYGINYVFIFELDQRKHLSKWQFLQIPLLMFHLWSTSFFLFMWSAYNDHKKIFNFYGLAWIHPIALTVLIAGWLVLPTKRFAGGARFWFLNILWRIICAPFYPVSFADFWLADQLTSLSEFLFLAQFVLCLYVPGQGSDAVNFCTNTLTLSLPILNAFPFYSRTMQCLRRFKDTKKAHPHLTNAGKYFSNLLAIALAFADTRIFAATTTKGAWNHMRTAWLVMNIISTLYKLFWDIYMDWGLFQGIFQPHVKYPFLRKHCLFHPALYYFAIIINTLIRWSWLVLSVLRIFGVDTQVFWVGLLVPMIELFRRFVWNIFRLENEHLNNVGEYRAVRDIPLPFSLTDPVLPPELIQKKKEKPIVKFMRKICCCCPYLFGPAPIARKRDSQTVKSPASGEISPSVEEKLITIQMDKGTTEAEAEAEQEQEQEIQVEIGLSLETSISNSTISTRRKKAMDQRDSERTREEEQGDTSFQFSLHTPLQESPQVATNTKNP